MAMTLNLRDEGGQPERQIPRGTKPSIKFDFEWIDPHKATIYLALNFEDNRSPSGRKIELLATDMLAGNFVPTHQGIAFNEAGQLIDGQQRLTAIIESGEGQWMAVARNVPHGNVIAIDTGKIRDLAGRMVVTGEFSKQELTPKHTAVLFSMLMPWDGFNAGNRPSDVEAIRLFRIHREAINFARMHCKRRVVSNASVRGSVAKAYYHCKKNGTLGRLEHFLRVLDTGESLGPEDLAAIKFRDHLGNYPHLADKNQGVNCMRITSYVLDKFLKGESIRAIIPVSKDPFPLEDFDFE